MYIFFLQIALFSYFSPHNVCRRFYIVVRSSSGGRRVRLVANRSGRLFFEKIHRAVQQSVVCFENFAEKHFEIISIRQHMPKYSIVKKRYKFWRRRCAVLVYQLLSWYIVVWPNQLTPGAEVFSPLKVILFQFFFSFLFFSFIH